MQAKRDDLIALLKMQHLDLEALRAQKQLDGLPQRAAILEARRKRAAIAEKRGKLDELRAEAEGKLSRIGDEDAALAAKQRSVQEAIDASRGDYRSVDAHSKELNGIAKRRNTLEGDIARASEELEKIEGMIGQVDRALAELERQEAQATTSFQKEGGALKADLARVAAEREQLAASLPGELRDLYERTAARSGGIAVGRLKENRCGVCRNPIDGGRLIEVKASAPLATCPSCKRLLVVE